MFQKKYQLKRFDTSAILYEGWFMSFKDCLEKAVEDNVDLAFVDCSGQNLACANLDNARMRYARFHKTNLNGANLSECILDGADFWQADLANACLNLSSIIEGKFIDTSFRYTDVTDAIIKKCYFSCPSALRIPFYKTSECKDNLFVDEQGQVCPMNESPITILGLPYEIVFLSHHIKIGHDLFTKQQIRQKSFQDLSQQYNLQIAAFLTATRLVPV